VQAGAHGLGQANAGGAHIGAAATVSRLRHRQHPLVAMVSSKTASEVLFIGRLLKVVAPAREDAGLLNNSRAASTFKFVTQRIGNSPRRAPHI
jgi:hypothetical protein